MSESVTITKPVRLASGSSGVDLPVGQTLTLPQTLAASLIAAGEAIPAAPGSAPVVPPALRQLLASINGQPAGLTLGSGLSVSPDGKTVLVNGGDLPVAPANAPTATPLAERAAFQVFLEDYILPPDGDDIGPAIQRIHDAHPNGGVGYGQPKSYRMRSPVVITNPFRVIFPGAMDALGNPVNGATLTVDDPSFIPFTITSTAASDPRGAGVVGVSFVHEQPFGVVPFVPVDYPPAILVANTYGGAYFDDIMFKGATRGILALGCGHFEIRKVIGQVFRYLVSIDGCADTAKIDHLRCWTYLSGTSAIETWCQAAAVGLELGRCDGIDLGNIFCFSHLSVVRGVMGHQVAFAPTAAVAVGSTSVPLADTSGLCAGMTVLGTGVPPGTTVASVPDGTHVVLSAATVRPMGTVSPLVFGCYGAPQVVQTTGTEALAQGSTTVPVSSTAGLWVGQSVLAEFLPLGTWITAIGSGSVTVSNPSWLPAPVGATVVFGSGFPTAFATAAGATTSATTLAVSGLSGNLVPNMRLVSAVRGGTAQARVLSVSGSTVTLDTAVTVASGAPLIFQMPPAGNTGGGVPQISPNELNGDRARILLWLDGLSGKGTMFTILVKVMTAGGQSSAASNLSGDPLDLAHSVVADCDLEVMLIVPVFTYRQYSTSAVRLGGGSANHIILGAGATIGTDVNEALGDPWGERPIFNLEPSKVAGYPNTLTVKRLIKSGAYGGPTFPNLAGLNAIGIVGLETPDNGGSTLVMECTGSLVDQVSGDRTLTAGGTLALDGEIIEMHVPPTVQNMRAAASDSAAGSLGVALGQLYLTTGVTPPCITMRLS